MTAATLETKAAFARRLGVNKSTITRAEQAGRLVMQGGKVEVQASLARWQATLGGRTDLSEKHAQKRAGSGQLAQQVSQPTPNKENPATGLYSPLNAIGTDDDATRTEYKAITLHFENQTIKLHMALAKGRRHRLEAVQREAYGLGAALAGGVERLIDQSAARLAAAPDAAARAALVQDACADLARAMRVEFTRSAKRLRNSGLRNSGGQA